MREGVEGVWGRRVERREEGEGGGMRRKEMRRGTRRRWGSVYKLQCV